MSTLKVHLTYQCTASCAHCRFFCTMDESDVIDPQSVVNLAEYLHESHGLDTLVILGGEPLLHFDHLRKIIEPLAGKGIKFRVETNGYWGSPQFDGATISRIVSFLKEYGVAPCFSLDSFHEPFVNPEHLLRALRECIDAGVKASIETAYLEKEHRENTQDMRTDALIAYFRQNLGESFPEAHYRGGILYNGRSASALSGRRTTRTHPEDLGPCRKAPWWGHGDLDTLELSILDPYGNITKGCGIIIGNIRTHTPREIYSGYSIDSHPVLKTLFEEGPIALAREAEQYGYRIKTKYADRCHLCQEARYFLRPVYPEYLGPDQHYPQEGQPTIQ